ncbi:uncharacterized protein LOC129373194 [Poeciliopsis prolifica]|uniref:uncharacterized protein LOC129373194 n=1 Tax=Poeciliopsis prolifica TaxID=188132 RepID=UPI0024136703|nr:uncharacterized protein LOC129373194 [Poeciliopsis prolifica]
MDFRLMLFGLTGALLSVACAQSRQYYFVNTSLTWTEAQSVCRRNYTDLATIESTANVDGFLNTTFSYTGKAWIGLYDDTLNSWKWSLNDSSFYGPGEYSFRNWQPTQPDDYFGQQHCVRIYGSSDSSLGQWDDIGCTETMQFVCYMLELCVVLRRVPAAFLPHTIQIKLCYGFYVYKLQQPSTCHLAYCTEPQPFRVLTQSETSITLQWNKINNNISFVLQFNGTETNISAPDGDGPVNYTVSSLTAGTKYTFTLFSVFGNVRNTVDQLTAVTAPRNAEGFTKSGQDDISITLQWNKINNSTSFVLLFNGVETFISAPVADGPVTYTVSSLTPGTSYTFTLFSVLDNVRSSGVSITAATGPCTGCRCCALGTECITTNGVVECLDPCVNYTVLNDAWRSTENTDNSVLHCDRFIAWSGWYRFYLGQSSAQIPEKCVAEQRCGTHAPLWINGAHPVQLNETVTRTVCNAWSSSCCRFPTHTIQIKLCYGYYIYKLQQPSTCWLAYCAEPQPFRVLTQSETSITLQWNKINNNISFVLQFNGTETNISAPDGDGPVNYMVSSLTAGTKYTFTLFFVFGNVRNSVQQLTAVTAPRNAEGFTKSGHNETSITLQWNKINNSTSYVLQFNGSETFITAPDGDGPVTYTVSSLTGGTTYTFTLYSVFENVRSSGVQLTAVTAPSNAQSFIPLSQDETSITLQWNKINDYTSFVLQFNGTETNITAPYGYGPVTHTVSSLTAGTRYTFTLISVLENLTSSGISIAAATAPKNAKGLRASEQNERSITLLWSKVNNSTNFILQINGFESFIRSPDGDGPVNYTVSSLAAGTKYTFTLFSVFENVRSSGVQLTAVTVPENAKGFRASKQDETSITLRWNKVGNNINFALQFNGTETNISAPDGDGPVKHTVTSLTARTNYTFTLFSVFENTRSSGVSILASTECITTSGVVECLDPCATYTVVNDAWRSTENTDNSILHCDQNIVWSGWYRFFLGQTSAQIPEKCVAEQRCGTHVPLWITEAHPVQLNQIVTRTVCNAWSGSCCLFTSHTIQIKLCQGYYVYKLRQPTACHLAYCAEPQPFRVLAQNETSITLQWNKINKSTSFVLQFIGSETNIRAPDRDGPVNHTVPFLTAGTKYTFTLYSVVENVRSSGVQLIAVTAPQNAEGFTKSGQYKSSITLQWNKINNNTSFVLQFNGTETNIRAPDGNGPVTHTVSSLTAGTKYTFTLFSVFENVRSSGVQLVASLVFGCRTYCLDILFNFKLSLMDYRLILFGLSVFLQTTSLVSVAAASCTGCECCASGTECITTNGVVECLDPCATYTVVKDAWRSTENTDRTVIYCDRNIVWSGWYRFYLGQTSAQIPEKCTAENRCGTHATLWINGTHPVQINEIVTRNVFGSWSGSCFAFASMTIQVKVCSGYYVYKVQLPVSCSLAYCTEIVPFKVLTQSETSITLYWGATTSSFVLQHDGKETNINAADGAAAVTHTVSSLTAGTRYTFTLYTVTGNVRNSGEKLTAVTAPQTAEGFTKSGQDETSITLQWNKINNNTSFVLQCDGTETNINAPDGDGPVNHTVSSLTAGTRYTFTLFSVFENVRSSGQQLIAVTTPQKAGGFTKSGQNESSITLQWNKINNNVSFVLQYDGIETNIRAPDADGPVIHTVSFLTAGTRYTFTLFSVFENVRSSGIQLTAVTGKIFQKLESRCFSASKAVSS